MVRIKYRNTSGYHDLSVKLSKGAEVISELIMAQAELINISIKDQIMLEGDTVRRDNKTITQTRLLSLVLCCDAGQKV